MIPQRLVIILGLVALMAISVTACGGDDDESTTTSDAGSEAVAPPPSTAFNNLSVALEGQGLVVTPTPSLIVNTWPASITSICRLGRP